MISRRTLWALLPFFILGCSDDSTTVQPPVPLTPDEQVVADCRLIRDKLEAYAAAHNGSYGEWDISLVGFDNLKNTYSGEHEPSTIRATHVGQIGLEAYACGGNIYGYRITGYGRDHMLITLESLANVPAEVLYTHDVTVANAFLVLDTANRFAAANDGVYSVATCCHVNNDGKYLIQLLPNSTMLVNPFTGSNTEPQDGNGIAAPGVIGYVGTDSGSGYVDSFTMEAYDCDGAILLTLHPFTQYGEIIWTGSYTLRYAVETFAKASGHYPHNLDSETTPGGKTVLDLISDMTNDHVSYFLNPYNQDHYVPTVGTATGNFTIGYQPIETAGTVTDYVITGRGALEEIVRLGPKPLP